jgi:hypothetical protein
MNTKEYRIFIGILAVCAAVVVIYMITQHPSTVTTPAVTNIPANSEVLPLSVVSINEDDPMSPQVNVEYPQFSSLPADFNDAIASSSLSRLDEFKKTVADAIAARLATSGASAEIATSSYSFNASWQSAQMNSRYVSFIIRYDSYSGGANENQDLATFGYDVASNTPVTLESLFPNAPDRLKVISRLVRAQLRSSLMAASPGYNPDAMLNEGTAPTDENFSRFTFTDKLITFYFPKYAVAPGAFGEQRTTIARSQVR